VGVSVAAGAGAYAGGVAVPAGLMSCRRPAAALLSIKLPPRAWGRPVRPACRPACHL